jgi:hypothetical protein
MTPSDWFTTNDIHNMLLLAKPSERKIRLFAIACYKHAVKPEDYQHDLKIAENYVEGTTHKNVLHIAYKKYDNLWGRSKPELCLLFTSTNLQKIITVVSSGTREMSMKNHEMRATSNAERKWQANLLRHMVKYDSNSMVHKQ